MGGTRYGYISCDYPPWLHLIALGNLACEDIRWRMSFWSLQPPSLAFSKWYFCYVYLTGCYLAGYTVDVIQVGMWHKGAEKDNIYCPKMKIARVKWHTRVDALRLTDGALLCHIVSILSNSGFGVIGGPASKQGQHSLPMVCFHNVWHLEIIPLKIHKLQG